MSGGTAQAEGIRTQAKGSVESSSTPIAHHLPPCCLQMTYNSFQNFRKVCEIALFGVFWTRVQFVSLTLSACRLSTRGLSCRFICHLAVPGARSQHASHSAMTLSLSGLHPITESPLPSPSAERLQPNETSVMSPAPSNTARFADDPISNQTSALSSPRGKPRAVTDGFDVNAAYVKALRDEQVSSEVRIREVWLTLFGRYRILWPRSWPLRNY